MSSIDLIILGLLHQRPKSAYELQKDVEDRHLSCWVKMSSPSIYKNVLRLEKKGLLEKKVIKEGKMPEKSVYSLTDAGVEEFNNLMLKTSEKPVQVFLDFNAIIVNLCFIKRSEAQKCIENIRNSILCTESSLKNKPPESDLLPMYGRAIVEQQLMLIDVLEKWIQQFENNFDDKTMEGNGL